MKKITLNENELKTIINRVVSSILNENSMSVPLSDRRFKDSNDAVYSIEQIEQDMIDYNSNNEDEEPIIDDDQLEMIKQLPLGGQLNIDMAEYIIRIK